MSGQGKGVTAAPAGTRSPAVPPRPLSRVGKTAGTDPRRLPARSKNEMKETSGLALLFVMAAPAGGILS